jgi:hypothetical protein
VLPKWKAWSEAAKLTPALQEAEYPYPNKNARFIGYAIQKYRPRGGTVPSAAFQQWIDQIRAGVEKRLLPALRAADMLLPEDVYERAGYKPQEPLFQMPDFNSLIARSQCTKCQFLNLATSSLIKSV